MRTVENPQIAFRIGRELQEAINSEIKEFKPLFPMKPRFEEIMVPKEEPPAEFTCERIIKAEHEEIPESYPDKKTEEEEDPLGEKLPIPGTLFSTVHKNEISFSSRE